eukprot:COSAG05_NODE_6658_length_925_cov_0.707022_2_plen_106_part_00
MSNEDAARPTHPCLSSHVCRCRCCRQETAGDQDDGDDDDEERALLQEMAALDADLGSPLSSGDDSRGEEEEEEEEEDLLADLGSVDNLLDAVSKDDYNSDDDADV